MSNPDGPEHYFQDPAVSVDAFIEQHRAMLLGCLDGLTEHEARARLLPSKTTLLGLVKHGIFIERVWFGQAATGSSRAELGIPETPDDSFDLNDRDSIDSISAEYRRAVADSRHAVAGLGPAAIFSGNRRGELSLGWIQLHMLRELAQHCGHADILRELVLAQRGPTRQQSLSE